MATRKKGAQILFPLESAEAFQKAVDESEKFLAVVDVYQSWTGPTSVMEPVFRRIKMEKERVPGRAHANAQSGCSCCCGGFHSLAVADAGAAPCSLALRRAADPSSPARAPNPLQQAHGEVL